MRSLQSGQISKWNFAAAVLSIFAMAEKSLSAIPRPQRDLYEKGVLALQRNNFDYALSILMQVLRVEPGFFDARQALRAAQFKKAGGQTSFFKRVVGGATSQPALAKAQMALRKNPLEAIEAAEEILNGDPQNTGAHKLLAEAASAAGFVKTAVLSLEILYKDSPKDRKLALELADAYAHAGQPCEGRGRLQRPSPRQAKRSGSVAALEKCHRAHVDARRRLRSARGWQRLRIAIFCGTSRRPCRSNRPIAW
jgi:tetratricopeptide (TPR) repeat protein